MTKFIWGADAFRIDGPCQKWDSAGENVVGTVWYVEIDGIDADGQGALLRCDTKEEAEAAIERLVALLTGVGWLL